MPYITADKRVLLDSHIQDVVDELRAMAFNRGAVNYVFSKVIKEMFSDRSDYSGIAEITGVLENVKQEFYRTVAAPYEDVARSKNGDI